jgi:peptide/nickel transport system permease protein
MSGARTTWRDWLLTETPESRRQAAWGRRYRMWLDFSGNPVAMLGLVLTILLFVCAAAAPLLATHDPAAQDLANRLAPPSASHWFGTDELGRDIYSRVVIGSRITLGMVLAVVLTAAPVGLGVGCVSGYFGGWADRVLMRVTDVFLAFPRLILALAFVAAIRPGVTSTVAAIALTAWPPYARLARAETLTIRNADYIAAIRLTGAGPGRIILRHVPRQPDRPGDAGYELNHPDRRGAGLPGHGRAAALAGVGRHGRHRAALHPGAMVGADGAGHCHLRCGPGVQPAGRRGARRAGPETTLTCWSKSTT